MKWLEGKSSKSSPPPQDCDSRSPRSSDRPSRCDGPARPPGSYSDAGGGQSGSGSCSDRSTGIVVTVNVGPSMFVWPCDAAAEFSSDGWHRMYWTEESNLLRKMPASVAFVVK